MHLRILRIAGLKFGFYIFDDRRTSDLGHTRVSRLIWKEHRIKRLTEESDYDCNGRHDGEGNDSGVGEHRRVGNAIWCQVCSLTIFWLSRKIIMPRD